MKSESQLGDESDGGSEDQASTGSNWWSHLIGPGMVAIGQPWIPKAFIVPGASKGTSVASIILSKIPGKSTFRLFTPVVTEEGGIRMVGTLAIGRWAGRAVPWIGWVLTAYDFGRYIAWPMAKANGQYQEENRAEGDWIANLPH